MAKKRINISIDAGTQERLLQYGFENHIPGGLSGAIEHVAWHVLKVKNENVRGQMSLPIDGKKK